MSIVVISYINHQKNFFRIQNNQMKINWINTYSVIIYLLDNYTVPTVYQALCSQEIPS